MFSLLVVGSSQGKSETPVSADYPCSGLASYNPIGSPLKSDQRQRYQQLWIAQCGDIRRGDLLLGLKFA